MVNYKNSKIYTIRSHHTDKIYIGSTCNELRKRLHQHKYKYKYYLNGKYHYTSSFEIVKYDDAYIELYEYYPCNNKVELLKREGELIRKLDCVNKQIAGRSNKEKCKEYYKTNKIKILEKQRTIKYNCICGNIVSYNGKARHQRTIKHRTYIFNLHNELNHL